VIYFLLIHTQRVFNPSAYIEREEERAGGERVFIWQAALIYQSCGWH
jgi:hypothetical protein